MCRPDIGHTPRPINYRGVRGGSRRIFACSDAWSFNDKSAYTWYNCVNNQQDALYRLIYYSKSALHVSGDVFVHHQEHLTVFTVSDSVHPRCCWLVSWMNWNWTMWIVRRVYTPHNPHSSVSTHPRHQPAATWVNTTRYCKYSQVLLMMDENIARNM